jgi:hypothetical protein
MILSKSVDEFVPPDRWIVSLSNGETVFDDTRPIEPTWVRLAEYVKANNLSITGLRVQFKSGLELKLPSGQAGYIQKKKAWCTGASGGIKLCVGFTEQNGNSVIHEVSADGDSHSVYCKDPGEPWTIYRSDLRK